MKLLSGLLLYLETWKNLEFENLGKKNLEKPGTREILKKTWDFEQKSLKNQEKPEIVNNFFMLSSKIPI